MISVTLSPNYEVVISQTHIILDIGVVTHISSLTIWQGREHNITVV